MKSCRICTNRTLHQRSLEVSLFKMTLLHIYDFLRAINKYAHSPEPYEIQKIKVDLDATEQTL